MASKDITSILEDWEAQPSGGVAARIIRGDDGNEMLQLRLDLGLLQMKLDGRPDGTEPRGKPSLLEYYQFLETNSRRPLELDEDDWSALDAELMQYYHRRVGLLATASQAQARHDEEQAIAYYRRAARDADHNLAIMDFIRAYADDEEYVAGHEQYRSLLVCHKTLAISQAEALSGRPNEAIDAVNNGIQSLETLLAEARDEEEDDEDADLADDEMLTSSIRALRRLNRELRRQYGVNRTLREQLDEAIDREDYEEAARLRDQIRQVNSSGSEASSTGT